MRISKREAGQLAASKRDEAARFRREVERKQRQADTLLDKARRQSRSGRIFSLGGPAGKLVSATQKRRAMYTEEKARELEKQAKYLEQKAGRLVKEARDWDSKGNLAN